MENTDLHRTDVRPDIYHGLEWNPMNKVFRCRWGACGFETTKEELELSGHTTDISHVHIIKESDLNG
jgi:hypothetical protein